MSDSASACRLARELFLKKNPSIVQHRCIAHLLNNIGEDFSKQSGVCDLFCTASKLTTFLSRNARLCAELSSLSARRVVKPCATRWYSNVNCLESLLEVKDDAINLLRGTPFANDELFSLLLNSLFWSDLKETLKIVRPLANCIAIAEGSASSLGEAMKAILEFGKSIFEADWENAVVVAAAKSFIAYFNPLKVGDYEFAIFLAAYSLDRRNKFDYITEDSHDSIVEAILRLGMNQGISSAELEKSLLPEYTKFVKQEGIHSRLQTVTEKASIWWKNQPNFGILRNIPLRFANLKSSTANTERLFSTLKYIQGSHKTNLHISTLENIARCKLAFCQDANCEPSLCEYADEDLESAQPSKYIRHIATVRNLTVQIESPANTHMPMLGAELKSYHLSKLGCDFRERYEEFTLALDFSICNSFKEDFCLNEENDSDESITMLVRKAKQLRQ